MKMTEQHNGRVIHLTTTVAIVNRNQAKSVLRVRSSKLLAPRGIRRTYVGIVPDRYPSSTNTTTQLHPHHDSRPSSITMLRMVMDRRIQSIHRSGSIDMVVGEAILALLQKKRSTTYKTRAYLWSMMRAVDNPGSGRRRRWP